MVIKSIDPNVPDETIIEYAARVINSGGVVIFPSDSSYGLATNPTNKEALQRLFKIKGRAHNKQVSCIFRDISQIEKWAQVGKAQRKTLERNLPGPFTFVLKARSGYPLEGETVGIRIPDNSITKALAYATGEPYTATSANLAGNDPAYNLKEVFANFDGQIFQPDLMLDAGELPRYPASAVVDISNTKPVVIREGVAKVR